MKKTISIAALILSLIMLLSSCAGNNNEESTKPTEEPVATPNPELVKNTINATIELEDGSEISLELYPDLAPETVENFVELAEDGFYDGTIFHRVIENFMIQGGGYDENLNEKKTASITGEFAENGFENSLSHGRGVISMARTTDPDSASSQFFIVQKNSTYLDGKYAAFGRVTEGMEVVDEIAGSKTGTVAATGMEDVPIKPVIIETITIDTSADTDKTSSKNNSKTTDKPKSTSKSDVSDKSSSSPFGTDDNEEDKNTNSSSSNSSSEVDEETKQFLEDNGLL